MAEQKAERHLARNSVIVLAVLVGLYALAGFLLLPWWLEKALPEQLEQRMGWQAQVESIRVNPFALSMEAEGFAARDQADEPVTAFEKLRVDVSFLQLVRGIIGFEEIRLTEPDIRLDLLEDYSVNYARDWQNANPPASEPEPVQEPPAPSEPPRLFFRQIAIEGGQLLFRDFSQPEAAEFLIEPLDLALNDLATWQREESDSQYSVTAAIGDQHIDWQGDLSVTPLYSQGRLKVSDIRHDTLAHFLAPYLPWQLRDGAVTVESRYQLAGGDQFELITSGGKLSIRDLALALNEGDEEPALTTRALTVNDIGFDLTAREASVGMVTIEAPFVAASRDAEGMVDWVTSLPAGEQAAEAAGEEPASSAPAFRWSVEGVELTEGGVRWRDRVPETPAELTLTDLAVTLGGLSQQMDEPVPYSLSAGLASGGSLRADGQVTPAPFNFEGALAGTDIALAAVEPYLQLGANLAINEGRLGFDGNLDLDSQDDPMTGTFSGTAQIADLDLRLADQDGQLVSWQLLRLAPVEFNVNPARLEIGTVTLAQPAFNLVRDTGGAHNVERIVKTGADAGTEQAGAAQDDSAAEQSGEPGFIFRIGELLVEEGSVAYTDRTMEPVFNTTFDTLSGSVTGISNVPPQQGSVNLQGRLAGVAPVTFKGTLGALGTEDPSELQLNMDDLALPVLSPYFGRFLGYGVDSGKLKLDLDYEFIGTRLKASNQVVLDRMELGQAVASEEAVNAPVKLGLALLTDRQGVIEVDLPIEGDLSDPQFSVGQIVMRAFVNLLVKAAASPFSMLGSLADLAGFSSEELGQVSFVPGSVQLASGEAEKLSALAGALNDRPDLLLNIRGAVATEADGLALLKAEREARGEPVTGEAWEQAQQAYRNGELSLPPETLGKLATDRGVAVRRLLQDTHGVPSDQLFTLEPSRQAAVDDQGQVTVPFNLDVR